MADHDYQPLPPQEQGEHPPCNVCSKGPTEHGGPYREVNDRTLWLAVQVALDTYRNSPDLGVRARAANVLTALPAWMQADPYTPPKAGSERVTERMTGTSSHQPHCDWCGRAIKATEGRWEAVKGAERGYDPLACDANPDGAHEPADHVRSHDPDGKPLGYCAACFEDWPCATVRQLRELLAEEAQP